MTRPRRSRVSTGARVAQSPGPTGAAVSVHTSRRRQELSTPQWLRAWAALVVLQAVVLLAVTTGVFVRLGQAVEVIRDRAAPQAVVASDLYDALSDLDAQVGRLITIGNAPDLAGDHLDALRTLRQRNAEIDLDLATSLAAAGDQSERATTQRLMDRLTVYREISQQGIAIQERTGGDAAGSPPPATLAYDNRATLLLHGELLTTARALRASSQARLDDAYASQRATVSWGLALIILAGAGLALLLLAQQRWLARRFHRWVQPWLIAATVIVVGLTVTAGTVLTGVRTDLDVGLSRNFTPYLGLTQAQAVSYDATGDTSRYLIVGTPQVLQQRFDQAAACLARGGDCGDGDRLPAGIAELAAPTVGQAQGRDLLSRWQAYQRAHQHVIALGATGRRDEAIQALVGIGRGQASFEFFQADAAVQAVTDEQHARFASAVDRAVTRMTGWTVLPTALTGAVILFALMAVRPRLAEYRPRPA
jgi:hypothetical protein